MYGSSLLDFIVVTILVFYICLSPTFLTTPPVESSLVSTVETGGHNFAHPLALGHYTRVVL